MTFYEWIQTGQWIVMAIGIVLLWGIKTAIAGGGWFNHQSETERQQSAKIAELARIMEDAGGKVSDLATEVQGWSARARAEFVPLDASRENWTRYREDYRDVEQRLREVELTLARVQASFRTPEDRAT